jgi:hypothetical protein
LIGYLKQPEVVDICPYHYYQFFSNMPKSLLNLININFNCIITHSQNGKQENAKAQLN